MPTLVATGQFTIQDVMDGLYARLSNEAATVPADTDGSNADLTGCVTTISIFLGALDVSAEWTVTAQPSNGVTGALAGKTYTVTGITSDSGYVDLIASKPGQVDITARFTIAKARRGYSGPAIDVVASRAGISFVDNFMNPPLQDIGFTLIRNNAADKAGWYATDNVTPVTDDGMLTALGAAFGGVTGIGDNCYLHITDFGADNQVALTCIVGSLVHVKVIPRLDRATAEPFADVTGNNTAAAIVGQSDWATYYTINPFTMANKTQHLDNTTGFLTDLDRITSRPITRLKRADNATDVTEAAVVTGLGTAAAIAGQGALATQSSLAYGGSYLTGFGGLAGLASVNFGSAYLLETSGGAQATLANFKTGLGTAAAISGQGYLATQNFALASRMLVAGYDNIIPDSDYRDSTWWGFQSLPNVSFQTGDNFWEQERQIQFVCDRDFDFSSTYFAVEPGSVYRVRARIWNNGSTWTGAFWPLIHMPGVAWWSLKHGTGVNYTVADANNAIVALGDTGVQEFYFRATANTMKKIQFRFKSTARGSNVLFQVQISKVPQLGKDLIKPGTATKYTTAEVETGLGTAAAIVGQGAGATANNLAQLDATAASQLAALANVSKQTAAYGETIKRRLAAGNAVALDAIVNCNSGGVSGSIRARIDARPYGGSWSTVATGTGSSTGPSEPGGDSVVGTFTNSTGIEQLFEFRVMDLRTPAGAGGTIIYPQSYVVG